MTTRIEQNLFRHVYETLPLEQEATATLALLIRAATGEGLIQRLARLLRELHQATAGAFSGDVNKGQVEAIEADLYLAIEQADIILNDGPQAKSRAANPGMPGLAKGPHPVDPGIVRYQREIAPALKLAVGVAAILQSQGRNDLADPLYVRAASLLTAARRICMRVASTPQFDTQIESEVRNTQRLVSRTLTAMHGKGGAA